MSSALVTLALSLLGVIQLTRAAAEQLGQLNSDQLYLPSLYRDIFVDHGSLRDWALPPAPSFFPDLVLYAIAERLTGAIGLALALAVCAQFALVVALAWLLFRTIGAAPRPPVRDLMLSALLLLVLLSDHPMRHDFFSVAHHGGVLAVGLGVAALWSRRQGEWRRRDGASMALLVFLGAVSDLIFLPQFLLPLCGAAFVLVVSGRVAIRVALQPLVAAVLGLLPALGAIHLLALRTAHESDLPHGPLHPAATEPPHGLVQLDSAVLRVNVGQLFCALSGPFLFLLLGASALAFLSARSALQGPPNRERRHALFVSVFFLGSMACAACAPVITVGVDPRYMLPVYFLPALSLPSFLRGFE